jgi:hypothetical protein
MKLLHGGDELQRGRAVPRRRARSAHAQPAFSLVVKPRQPRRLIASDNPDRADSASLR